jgi:hypothetical protein
MSNSSLPATRGLQRSPFVRAGVVLACVSLGALATLPPAGASIKPSVKVASKLSQAVAIASESLSNVVTLHDMAVSVGKGNGIPDSVVHSSGQRLEVIFASEGHAASALDQTSSSPTGSLAASLVSYSGLASKVVAATGDKPSALGTSFTTTLMANDKRWEAALSALGKADHVNLLKEVPKLLYPTPSTQK